MSSLVQISLFSVRSNSKFYEFAFKLLENIENEIYTFFFY